MPRLETFNVKIRTGAQGIDESPAYSINGFPLGFDTSSGGVGPGETFEGLGQPQSFPHSLLLSGPTKGAWEIEGVEVSYRLAGQEPYQVTLGPVTLDARSDLNLWYERPPKLIDV